MNFLRSIFDNDSVFGQLMTRCGTIIAANLLFLLFSIPVVTTGAAWTALHYTMMKMLREKEINPFKTFWNGCRFPLLYLHRRSRYARGICRRPWQE